MLLELFLAVGHLVLLSKLEEYPELAAASVVALEGYLPADVGFDGVELTVLAY